MLERVNQVITYMTNYDRWKQCLRQGGGYWGSTYIPQPGDLVITKSRLMDDDYSLLALDSKGKVGHVVSIDFNETHAVELATARMCLRLDEEAKDNAEATIDYTQDYIDYIRERDDV